MVFFEPSSPYYFITVAVSAGLLLIATISGLLYQAFFYKPLLIRKVEEEGV